MKKKIILPLLLVLLGAGVLAVAVVGGTKLLDSHTEASASCKTTGRNYVVTIQHDAMKPAALSAQRCDTLTVRNLDAVTREIGFGNHDHHVPYDGVSERVLHEGESLTVTLVKTGQFHYHDHFHDEVAGSFTVN